MKIRTGLISALVVIALIVVGTIAYEVGVTMSPVVTVTQTTVSSDAPNITTPYFSSSSYPKVRVVGSSAEVLGVMRVIGYLNILRTEELTLANYNPIGWLESHPGVLFNNYAAFNGVAYFEGSVVTITVTKTVDIAEARVRDFILYVRSGPPYNYPHLERNLAWSDMSPWGIRSLKIEELRLSQDNKIIEVYNVVYVDLNENTYRYDALAIER